jgi:hypothetical protein
MCTRGIEVRLGMSLDNKVMNGGKGMFGLTLACVTNARLPALPLVERELTLTTIISSRT